MPLLPAGSTIFDALPIGAVVLDALAPAVGNGLISIHEGESAGALVIRNGAVAESVWVGEGIRRHGDDALASIRGSAAATVSARRMNEETLSLLGPLIRSEPCYSDLRLEWVGWPQLLSDLRGRGGTFVVELQGPSDRGVTVIQDGRQIATYSDSHPALGDSDLLDVLAAGHVGTVRVLADHDRGGQTEHAAAAPAVVQSVVDPPRPLVEHALERVSMQADDPNPTLSALFGPPRALPEGHSLLTMQRSVPDSSTQVSALLPELMLLARDRLQRSSGSVEDVINEAAREHRSVDWLAERVRATTVRGFMRNTFDQLADEMLTLRSRETH